MKWRSTLQTMSIFIVFFHVEVEDICRKIRRKKKRFFLITAEFIDRPDIAHTSITQLFLLNMGPLKLITIHCWFLITTEFSFSPGTALFLQLERKTVFLHCFLKSWLTFKLSRFPIHLHCQKYKRRFQIVELMIAQLFSAFANNPFVRRTHCGRKKINKPAYNTTNTKWNRLIIISDLIERTVCVLLWVCVIPFCLQVS